MSSSELPFSEWALQQVRERRFLIDRVDQWIYDEIMPYLGQRVLEVGCGLGNLMCHLLERELVVGIDTHQDSIRYLRNVYGSRSDVQVHNLDICDPEVLDLASLMLDTVVSLNVLEHIEDDVLALSHIRKLLHPEGNLVLVVPAHVRLYGTMDRSIGHYRRYSKALMEEKLTQSGFVPLVQKYVNSVGALGWFINGKLFQQTVPPSGQLKLFNRFVPFIQRLERGFPPPFGISLMTIAK